MCVIIHQPAGKRLTKHDAKALWAQNPDGAGIAYPHGKRVIVTKAMTFPQFWQSYRSVTQKHPAVDVLIHMRIATHGAVSLDNTHPFTVGDSGQTVMAHNGVIWDCLPHTWETRSDTRVFVEDALPRLPDGWLDDYYLVGMVTAYVESSRLMFLTVDPALEQNVYRLGRWETHKGLWLSNTFGLPTKTKTKTTGKTGKGHVLVSTGKGWETQYGNGYKWGNKWSPSATAESSPFADIDEDDLDDDEYDAWLNAVTGGQYAWDIESK
jgi:Glutamine amidotransferases class-II